MRRRHRLVTAVATAPVLALGLLVAPAADAAPVGGAVTVAPAYPPGVIGTATINATVFHRGDTVVVTVSNTKPGRLTMDLYGPRKRLGVGRVDRTFSGTVTGTIPAKYVGSRTIQVEGAGGEIYPFSITVVRG